MTAIKRIGINKCGQGCKETGTMLVECRIIYPLWKRVWWFPKVLNIKLYSPAISPLGLHPREMETHVLDALFIMTKNTKRKTKNKQACKQYKKQRMNKRWDTVPIQWDAIQQYEGINYQNILTHVKTLKTLWKVMEAMLHGSIYVKC